MLFKEIIAVYCENHTEHTKTLCGQNVFVSDVICVRVTHLTLEAQSVSQAAR
jgi:hypothetical protein